MLFEVAIIEVPTEEQVKAGAFEKLIFGPKFVIAKDIQSAGMKAVMEGERPVVDMDRAQVMIRPFA